MSTGHAARCRDSRCVAWATCSQGTVASPCTRSSLNCAAAACSVVATSCRANNLCVSRNCAAGSSDSALQTEEVAHDMKEAGQLQPQCLHSSECM